MNIAYDYVTVHIYDEGFKSLKGMTCHDHAKQPLHTSLLGGCLQFKSLRLTIFDKHIQGDDLLCLML